MDRPIGGSGPVFDAPVLLAPVLLDVEEERRRHASIRLRPADVRPPPRGPDDPGDRLVSEEKSVMEAMRGTTVILPCPTARE